MRSFWGRIYGMYALAIQRREPDRSFILLAMLTILNLIDFLLTKNLVNVAGFEAEGNPILYHFMVATGTVYAIMWAKVMALIPMWAFYPFVTQNHRIVTPERLERILMLLNITFVCIVAWGLFLNVQLLLV